MHMTTLGDIYRQHLAENYSGSLIYRPVPEQPRRINIYEGSPQYQGLGQYQNRPEPVDTRSELAKTYNAENSPWERAARQAAIADEAEARAQAQQAALDVMHGRGLDQTHGMFTAADRQACRDYAAGARENGAPIERNGGMTTSIGPAPARVFASQIEGPSRMAVRPAIPHGSSGEGWIGVDR
jgi:hypothetical protein